MTEYQYKLNKDMHRKDAVFGQITFEDIIDALHTNEKTLDKSAVHRVAKEIFDSRKEDFLFLIRHNISEIIAVAAKGRN